METAEYRIMFEQERTHWWFRGMRGHFLSLVKEYLEPGRRLLDLGMGTGIVSRELRARGYSPVGVDFSAEALRLGTARGPLPAVRARGEDLPLRTGGFDGALCLDMAEHVDDDRRLFAEVNRVLCPGGVLILSVPAHPFLWSAHDKALGHVRRYRRADILALLDRAGFTVERAQWMNVALFPLIALVRLLRRRGASETGEVRSDMRPSPPFVNGILLSLLRFESAATRWVPFLPGVSLTVVARKR